MIGKIRVSTKKTKDRTKQKVRNNIWLSSIGSYVASSWSLLAISSSRVFDATFLFLSAAFNCTGVIFLFATGSTFDLISFSLICIGSSVIFVRQNGQNSGSFWSFVTSLSCTRQAVHAVCPQSRSTARLLGSLMKQISHRREPDCSKILVKVVETAQTGQESDSLVHLEQNVCPHEM